MNVKKIFPILGFVFFSFASSSHVALAKNITIISNTNKAVFTNKIFAGDWDYVKIKKTILLAFPEAYPELFEITFTDWDNKAHPQTASFCVPDKYFTTKLTQSELDKRAKLLTERFEYTGCESIMVAEPTMYSYLKWEDKKIRRVTFHFGIGC